MFDKNDFSSFCNIVTCWGFRFPKPTECNTFSHQSKFHHVIQKLIFMIFNPVNLQEISSPDLRKSSAFFIGSFRHSLACEGNYKFNNCFFFYTNSSSIIVHFPNQAIPCFLSCIIYLWINLCSFPLFCKSQCFV